MKRHRILLAALALVSASCASTSQDVPPSIVPITPYESLACRELSVERRQLESRIEDLSHRIDRGVMAERIKMGVGVTLFWPALLLIGDNTGEQDELARLKGARFTVHESMRTRGCPLPPALERQA